MTDLVIGDPHVVNEELDDWRALADGLVGVIQQYKPDRVVVLGDFTNNHAVARVEVLAEGRRSARCWLDAGTGEVVFMVGNHDLTGDGRHTSLLAFMDMPGVRVIDRPTRIGPHLFVPYCKDPAVFLAAVRAHPDAAVLFCHQTFAGARYENGFPAEDGVDPADCPQLEVISGHFHTPQMVGKAWYPGAPRWRTIADAGVDRAVWLLEYDAAGRTVAQTPFDTARWCRRIVHVVDREDADLRPLVLVDPKDDVRVDVHGSRAYVEERLAAWEAAGARSPRGFRTDLQVAPEVRESEGLAVAFQKFVAAWPAPGGTPAEVLRAMARERLGAQVVG